jgi:hypothetical protein
MTTFTSEDREAAYKHDEPTHIVDSGASVMTLRDAIEQDTRLEMYREQIHAQQCEINALRTALIYARPAKELTDEEIRLLINDVRDYDIDTHDLFEFARAILRKAQEK